MTSPQQDGGSVPIPFPLGAVVWRARVNKNAELIPCPACLSHTRSAAPIGTSSSQHLAPRTRPPPSRSSLLLTSTNPLRPGSLPTFDSGWSRPFIAAGEALLSDRTHDISPSRLSGCTQTIETYIRDLDFQLENMETRRGWDIKALARGRNELVLCLLVDGIELAADCRRPFVVKR